MDWHMNPFVLAKQSSLAGTILKVLKALRRRDLSLWKESTLTVTSKKSLTSTSRMKGREERRVQTVRAVVRAGE